MNRDGHLEPIQTEAVIRITLETGGTIELIQGAIGASGYYHVKMVDADFNIDTDVPRIMDGGSLMGTPPVRRRVL